MKIDTNAVKCYNAKEVLRASSRKEKDGAWLFTSDAYESKGGDTMSDFEIIHLVILVATLVLAAVDFGRNSNNRNK